MLARGIRGAMAATGSNISTGASYHAVAAAAVPVTAAWATVNSQSAPAALLAHYACWRCSGRGQRFRLAKAATVNVGAGRKGKRKAETATTPSASPSPQPDATPSPPPGVSVSVPSVLWDPCSACRGSGLLPASSFDLSGGSRTIFENTEECESAPASIAEFSPSPEVASSPRRTAPPIASDSAPLVVIAGCGIGGSALALALQQRGRQRVLVFERDSSCAARAQGYGLTMQQGGSALAALGVSVQGVASVQHRSFDAAGKLVGCYGRESRGEHQNQQPLQVPSAGNKSHSRSFYRRTDGGASTLGDASAAGNGTAGTAGRHNLHLPRQRLRAAIIEQLLPDTVRWGVSIERFEEDPLPSPDDVTASQRSRGVTVHLSDGSSQRCSLLVGCEGLRSLTRSSKLRDGPASYLGIIVILGFATCPDPALLKRRVTQTADGETRMYTMPFSGAHRQDHDNSLDAAADLATGPADPSTIEPDTTMWQLSFPISESAALALSAGGPAALLAEALRRCGGWHAPLPQLLASTPLEAITGYPAYDRDLPSLEMLRSGQMASAGAGFSAAVSDPALLSAAQRRSLAWARGSRVTMLGDAVHPMSPFKGQGANQALLDAVALARAVAHARFDLSIEEELAEDIASLSNDDDAQQQQQQQQQIKGGLASPTPSSLNLTPRVSVALADFERSMLARCRSKVMESRVNAHFLHSPAVLSEGNCSRASVAKQAAAAAASTV